VATPRIRVQLLLCSFLLLYKTGDVLHIPQFSPRGRKKLGTPYIFPIFPIFLALHIANLPLPFSPFYLSCLLCHLAVPSPNLLSHLPCVLHRADYPITPLIQSQFAIRRSSGKRQKLKSYSAKAPVSTHSFLRMDQKSSARPRRT